MPAQIQSPRVMERLFRAFGIQGKHPLSLDNTVVPVAIVEDLSDRATDFLGTAWVWIRCDATALTESSIQLTNAGARSSVDLTIDRVRVKSQLAMDILLHVTDLTDGALLLGQANKLWSDGNQLPGVPPGVPDHRDGSAYGAADILAIADLLLPPPVADSMQTFEPGWVLAPGQKFVARGTTDNVRMEAYIQYSVRRRISA